MTRTKASTTKGRKTKDKRREKDRKAREHTKRIIKGILGETGKDRMYRVRGKEQRKKGEEYQDQDNGATMGATPPP